MGMGADPVAIAAAFRARWWHWTQRPESERQFLPMVGRTCLEKSHTFAAKIFL
jgi:hypothetical protein